MKRCGCDGGLIQGLRCDIVKNSLIISFSKVIVKSSYLFEL